MLNINTERGNRGRCSSPYGGIIRIRFNGSNLSLKAPLSNGGKNIIFFVLLHLTLNRRPYVYERIPFH